MKKHLEKPLLILSILYTTTITATITLTTYTLLQNTTLLITTAFILSIVLANPLKYIYKNADQLEKHTTQYIKENQYTVKITIPIFLMTSLTFHKGTSLPIIDLINISYSASSRIFSQLQYLPQPLTLLGELTYNFTRNYLHLTLIYVITNTLSEILSSP